MLYKCWWLCSPVRNGSKVKSGQSGDNNCPTDSDSFSSSLLMYLPKIIVRQQAKFGA